MDNIIIDVNNISKFYKLYRNPTDRLKESLNPFKRKYHDEYYALRDVNFKVYEGQTLGLIGKNGAGKSTLLKIITGVLTPSSGNVKVNGRISALLELGAGFNPELSGMENIFFNGMIMGYSREEMQRKIDEIVDFADIGQYIHQPVKTYSSGMYVRLAFSVAVSVEPEILIVDEALSVGDVRFKQKATRKMKELIQKAKAILFVTHDMESVKSFCSDVVWLKDGSVYEQGQPKDIIPRYYNYMIHDILPEKKKDYIQKSDIKQGNSNSYSRVEWRVLDRDSEVVGTSDVIFHRFSFYNEETFSFIDTLTEKDQNVGFTVEVESLTSIVQPIFGFGIFDQYGVAIVHFNTSSINEKVIYSLDPGKKTTVRFSFKMPRLRSGTYTIGFGLNDGTLDNNIIIQHVRECHIFKIAQSGEEAKQQGLVLIQDAVITMD